MVPVYVSTLLPVFCNTFQTSMIPSVKKAALGLVKKIVHYMDRDLLQSISQTDIAGTDTLENGHTRKRDGKTDRLSWDAQTNKQT